MEDSIQIVNRDLKFKRVALKSVSSSHYIHLAAEIDRSIFPFFLTTSSKKNKIIRAAKEWCSLLVEQGTALDASVFSAILIPPGKGKLLQEREAEANVARYDFAVLIEVASQQIVKEVVTSNNYERFIGELRSVASSTHFITATNARRIDSVNHKKQGVFLFNYFYADDLKQNLDIWEYTAGWFQQETGLDNSTVLLPYKEINSKYTIINHCRWDRLRDVLPSLLFKKTFHTYVLENFYANKVAAMPVLYKKA
jgi:hypothetical protein